MSDTQTITLTNEETKMLFVSLLFSMASINRPMSDPFHDKYQKLYGKLQAAYENVKSEESENE